MLPRGRSSRIDAPKSGDKAPIHQHREAMPSSEPQKAWKAKTADEHHWDDSGWDHHDEAASRHV